MIDFLKMFILRIKRRKISEIGKNRRIMNSQTTSSFKLIPLIFALNLIFLINSSECLELKSDNNFQSESSSSGLTTNHRGEDSSINSGEYLIESESKHYIRNNRNNNKNKFFSSSSNGPNNSEYIEDGEFLSSSSSGDENPFEDNGKKRKRQLFREDIPHHRPLTGNRYAKVHGFPHASRYNGDRPVTNHLEHEHEDIIHNPHSHHHHSHSPDINIYEQPAVVHHVKPHHHSPHSHSHSPYEQPEIVKHPVREIIYKYPVQYGKFVDHNNDHSVTPHHHGHGVTHTHTSHHSGHGGGGHNAYSSGGHSGGLGHHHHQPSPPIVTHHQPYGAPHPQPYGAPHPQHFTYGKFKPVVPIRAHLKYSKIKTIKPFQIAHNEHGRPYFYPVHFAQHPIPHSGSGGGGSGYGVSHHSINSISNEGVYGKNAHPFKNFQGFYYHRQLVPSAKWTAHTLVKGSGQGGYSWFADFPNYAPAYAF